MRLASSALVGALKMLQILRIRTCMLLASSLAAALPAALWSAPAAAQAWPSRPIRIVAPYPAGVPPDIIARLMADKLAQIKTLLATEQKPKVDDFVKVFSPPAGGDVK